MKHFFVLFSIAFFMNFNLSAQMNYKVDLSVFPKPEKGIVQYVIDVPYSVNGRDSDKKIEFYIGKYTEVDNCNSFSLLGEISEKELTGYGYHYYEFQTKGDIMGTMMGCPDNTKITRFISSRPLLTQYNGRMPIVVYVPEGYEVRYKIYHADNDEYSAALLK